MKFLALATVFAVSASAFQMKACTSTDRNGACSVQTSGGKRTGNWKSYAWQGTRSDHCVLVCQKCKELGYRCGDYSNNNIAFDEFIIFDYDNGHGADNASCC